MHFAKILLQQTLPKDFVFACLCRPYLVDVLNRDSREKVTATLRGPGLYSIEMSVRDWLKVNSGPKGPFMRHALHENKTDERALTNLLILASIN